MQKSYQPFEQAESYDSNFGNRLENIFADYAHSITKIPAEQILPLVREAKAGNKQAAERLAGAYFRLINSEARKRRHRISLDELISAGLYGLALAIDKFTEDKGGSFGLFVQNGIKVEMERTCLKQSNNFNIPVARLQIYFQARGKLIGEDGNSDPDHEEIAAKVREIAKERKKPDKWMFEFSADESERIAQIVTPALSLDAPNEPSFSEERVREITIDRQRKSIRQDIRIPN